MKEPDMSLSYSTCRDVSINESTSDVYSQYVSVSETETAALQYFYSTFCTVVENLGCTVQ
jgi:hypothetical protein